MSGLVFALYAAMLASVCVVSSRGQMTHGETGEMHRQPAVPSTSLRLTGLGGKTKTLTVEEMKALPHVSVTVTNGHSHQQETYSGVPVKILLAMVVAKPSKGSPHVSPRTTVVVAGATDHFQVAMTLCDTDPGCRTGQAIVADIENGKPLTTDGAFKLILTEDKMPGRWTRNLESLTEKNVGSVE